VRSGDEVSPEPIRIGAKQGFLNKTTDCWQIVIHPNVGARVFAYFWMTLLCLAVVPFIIASPESKVPHRYIVGATMATFLVFVSLILFWSNVCSELLTMTPSGITIARYLGPLRFVNILSWERLRGPTLVSGVRFPPHILLEDPWEGRRSYVAIGSSAADVERLKDIIREFRTSTHGAASQVLDQSRA
jgi:hypothetical protein